MSEIETTANLLLDYVKSVCNMAWEPDRIDTILPANIPTVNKYCWVRVEEGFNFSFTPQTPIHDEVGFSFAITFHFRKAKGISTQDQVLKLISLFYDKFYMSLHPGGVGYQPQVNSIQGFDIEEKDDYAEINASVSINSFVTRNVTDRT